MTIFGDVDYIFIHAYDSPIHKSLLFTMMKINTIRVCLTNVIAVFQRPRSGR